LWTDFDGPISGRRGNTGAAAEQISEVGHQTWRTDPNSFQCSSASVTVYFW
jgi:hypothetical protein